MFFQSLPSSMGLAFLNSKPFNVPCFSDIGRLPIENRRQNAQTTKQDWIKYKIPIFCAKNRATVCTRIKNENSDYLIVLKKDIRKTEYCQLYSFSEHCFARSFKLYLSCLKSIFRGFLYAISRKGLSFCTCFISFMHDLRTILRDREL